MEEDFSKNEKFARNLTTLKKLCGENSESNLDIIITSFYENILNSQIEHLESIFHKGEYSRA